MLDANPARWGSSTIIVGAFGRPVAPYTIETAFKAARDAVDGLPGGQDPRPPSLLREPPYRSRPRHQDCASAPAPRLREDHPHTYGHMWPDRDESSRAAVIAVLDARKSPPQQGAETGSI